MHQHYPMVLLLHSWIFQFVLLLRRWFLSLSLCPKMWLQCRCRWKYSKMRFRSRSSWWMPSTPENLVWMPAWTIGGSLALMCLLFGLNASLLIDAGHEESNSWKSLGWQQLLKWRGEKVKFTIIIRLLQSDHVVYMFWARGGSISPV